MPTPLQIVIEEVNRTNAEIAEAMPKDEGKAKESLRVEVAANEVRSIGLHYIEYLDRGSGPWDDPSKFPYLGRILEESGWSDRKNTDPYAAAYTIAHEGSRIYKGLARGIELDEKLKDLEKRLMERLPQYISQDIKRQITSRLEAALRRK